VRAQLRPAFTSARIGPRCRRLWPRRQHASAQAFRLNSRRTRPSGASRHQPDAPARGRLGSVYSSQSGSRQMVKRMRPARARPSGEIPGPARWKNWSSHPARRHLRCSMLAIHETISGLFRNGGCDHSRRERPDSVRGSASSRHGAISAGRERIRCETDADAPLIEIEKHDDTIVAPDAKISSTMSSIGIFHNHFPSSSIRCVGFFCCCNLGAKMRWR